MRPLAIVNPASGGGRYGRPAPALLAGSTSALDVATTRNGRAMPRKSPPANMRRDAGISLSAAATARCSRFLNGLPPQAQCRRRDDGGDRRRHGQFPGAICLHCRSTPRARRGCARNGQGIRSPARRLPTDVLLRQHGELRFRRRGRARRRQSSETARPPAILSACSGWSRGSPRTCFPYALDAAPPCDARN